MSIRQWTFWKTLATSGAANRVRNGKHRASGQSEAAEMGLWTGLIAGQVMPPADTRLELLPLNIWAWHRSHRPQPAFDG